MQIIELLPSHWEAVKEIYAQGIATGNATFQTAIPTWNEWDEAHVKTPRLVAIKSSEVLGWAALTTVSGRCVYAGVAEISVYIAESARGKGVANALLKELITQSEKNNFWILQAGIFPENDGSIKIHANNGFRVIGRREKIGKMNDVWRDTLLLERRSNLIGID